MSAALYNSTILRLAASIPYDGLLSDAQAVSEKRSPICGSRVKIGVKLDAEGRIAEIGQEVRACALGQASASLMGASAIGRTPDELAEARDVLAAFLAKERDDPGDWPGLEIFTPARDYSARHPSIRLAFEAVAEAAANAAVAVA
jgi:NifU-like protein involved in Fe-S cluster formation